MRVNLCSENIYNLLDYYDNNSLLVIRKLLKLLRTSVIIKTSLNVELNHDFYDLFTKTFLM